MDMAYTRGGGGRILPLFYTPLHSDTVPDKKNRIRIQSWTYWLYKKVFKKQVFNKNRWKFFLFFSFFFFEKNTYSDQDLKRIRHQMFFFKDPDLQ